MFQFCKSGYCILVLQVRHNYDLLKDCTWVQVDADRTVDQVQDTLYRIVSAEVATPV